MPSHTNAGYKQYYDRPADQELKLGGEGEVSLQLDLYYNRVNIKCSGSTKRRKEQFGERLEIWSLYSLAFSKMFFSILSAFMQFTFQLLNGHSYYLILT